MAYKQKRNWVGNRGSKQRAIEFIALNDSEGNEDERLDAEVIAGYLSVQAIAAAWDQDAILIARHVVSRRRSLDRKSQ